MNALDEIKSNRQLREERNTLAERVTELEQQLTAKDDEIRELMTSDNKVIVDLSRYVETLEQKIADKNDAYRAACAVVAKMHEAAIGEVVGPVLGVVEVVANVREQLIEAQKQIVMLREELATTQSELETERRLSFRNQVAELERELFAMNGEITALKIQLLNRNVSNLEASENTTICSAIPGAAPQSLRSRQPDAGACDDVHDAVADGNQGREASRQSFKLLSGNIEPIADRRSDCQQSGQ